MQQSVDSPPCSGCVQGFFKMRSLEERGDYSEAEELYCPVRRTQNMGMGDKACRRWLTKRQGVAPFCRRTPATLAIHKILQSHHVHQLVQLLVKGLHTFVQGEAVIAAGSLRCRQWIDHLHDITNH